MSTDEEFRRLLQIVKRLRTDCPWDRVQTHESLRQGFIEETYEAVEAIDAADWSELKIELGDVLLHVALQSTDCRRAERVHNRRSPPPHQ